MFEIVTGHVKRAIVIQRLAFEDLGNLRPILELRDFTIVYQMAGIDDLSWISKQQPELLVILGGPIGVYQEEDYPFIRDELHLLEERLSLDLPTVGICFGAQLMARALGAKVFPGHIKEIGWGDLKVSEAGRQSCLKHLILAETSVLHWHGDTFDLPENAIRLASSENYENQAFAWENNGLALQFHGEVTTPNLESWFIGHAHEIATTSGVSVSQLRSDTRKYAPLLQTAANSMWAEWMDNLSL